MKIYNKKSKIIIMSAILIVSIFLASCTTPNPLSGRWIDNNGNKLTLNADSTFLLVLTSADTTVTYEGVFRVMYNVISFMLTNGNTIVSEWDIRASVLYIILPDPISTQPRNLSFYQVGK